MYERLLDRDDFLKKYRISIGCYQKTGLKWEHLQDIFSDYICKRPDYDKAAAFLADAVFSIEGVHSVKKRTKKAEHLIEKIIRKTIKNGKVYATLDDYESQVTDLIGIRAIHLYKEDWLPIHNYIMNKMSVMCKPIAYVSEGEDKKYKVQYEDSGCVVEKHPADYRSVHYNIKMKPLNKELIAEVQVRTVFEEGWSEMDHDLRYPYEQENEMFVEYLSTFNSLCRTADKMGSFIPILKEINESSRNYKDHIQERDKRIDELLKKITENGVNEENKQEISKEINSFKSETLIQETMDKGAGMSAVGGFLTGAFAAFILSQLAKDT